MLIVFKLFSEGRVALGALSVGGVDHHFSLSVQGNQKFWKSRLFHRNLSLRRTHHLAH
jgi:hypothetical protein